MKTTPFLALTLIVLVASLAQAGEIHPALEEQLALLGADEPIRVLVHMSERAPIARLDMELKERRATRRERHREVVLALQDAARSQGGLLEHLEERARSGGVRGYTSHWITNLVVLTATRGEIEEVAYRDDVALVAPDFTPVLIAPVGGIGADYGARDIGVTPGLRAVRAPEVWYELGYTGFGRLIGSMDTGVDGHHTALADRWRGLHAPWQECWLDVLEGDTSFPEDGDGHGTHTTGTMTGVAPNDSIGVAWGAEWIACNVIGQPVSEDFDNDVIAAFEWLTDPDGDPGTVDDVPDVVQNSWGVGEHLGYPDCYDLWWEVIDNCEAAGVVTIWSAGNSGPDAGTIGSPADRAATLTNSTAVGAVDATNYDWPYPIADFSSRGPTLCDVPPELEIKPEVVAPGVDVYSSIPGGGYGESDGTSMAGPHVAGIVALLRQADPNLDVDAIKEILMLTAHDEGDPGEDNTFGHGHVDAYDAVLLAIDGFGELRGFVRNGSWGDVPLPGAMVELVGAGWRFYTAADGYYSGLAAPTGYTARASLAGFAPQEFAVTVVGEGITVQDFSLTDIAGPGISNVSLPGTVPGPLGSYEIDATVIDYSTVSEARLYFRFNQSGWASVAMTPQGGDVYRSAMPALPVHTTVDYYIWARDGLGQESTDPPSAPVDFHTLLVTELVYAYDAEDPADPNWQLGVFGDDATDGLWVREDPVGTEQAGIPIQPENDHTPDPGVKCFVTGNGEPGGNPHADDIDGGCTTLLSPTFDLAGAEQAYLSYWRWFAQVGITADDEFAVDVSGDGGQSWVPLDRVSSNENWWERVKVELSALIPLNGEIVVRFLACDVNLPSLVEAAVDDFLLEGFTSTTTAAPGWEPQGHAFAGLRQNRPNPFRPAGGATRISFSLQNGAEARLEVFDIAGRLVRTLAAGDHGSGEHEVVWNGRDERGHDVSSGVYFYRLRSGEQKLARRMLLIR